MDSNLSESKEKLIVPNCSMDKLNKSDKSTDEVVSTATKPETKEKSVKYKTIGSRYMQSTQQWVSKRSEDSHNSSQGSSSRPPSRNPTPERNKTATKKASTPISTNKSMNLSAVSAIHKVDDNKDMVSKPELKKYSKPLITGRKSIAPKRLPFNTEPISSKSGPLTVSGLEIQKRNKEFEESIKRSDYIKISYLKLKAEQSRKSRKADALTKIGAIWRLNNEIRNKLNETNQCLHTLQQKIQTIDVLEDQKSCLEEYLKIRSEVDPLFNGLADLISGQKRLLKIENCSKEDFTIMSELLERCPNSQRLEMAEKATPGLNNFEELVNEMNSMENKVKALHKAFDKCFKNLQKYETIETQLLPEISLSLRKLF